MIYDLIIVGASAAGVSASIYAARRKLNFLVLTKDIGGEVLNSGVIENYPGFVTTDGFELTEKFTAQLTANAVDVRTPVTVTDVEKQGTRFVLTAETDEGVKVFEAKTVIIGSGMHPKLLGVPGEQELRGKGVSYCTTCDGPLFKGKAVATIGGGNSALESALMLADLCPHVALINKNPAMKGEQVLIDKIAAHPNIAFIPNAKTSGIIGTDRVSGVRYKDAAGAEHEVPAEGVFIHIGHRPNSNLAPQAKLNPGGWLEVSQRGETSVPGLFAAGDVASVPYWQIGIAVGTGITAALSAIEYLNRLKE